MPEVWDLRFGAFLAMAAVLILTPGPDTAMVTRNALRAGTRAASATTCGIAVGSVAWAVASVLGIALLIEQSVLAFTVFKLVGGAYLIYLGLRSLLSRHHAAEVPTAPGDAACPPLDARTAFKQGRLSNLLNPKAGAIFATALPQFIAPGDSPVRLLAMLLAYEAILLIWLHLFGLLLSRVGTSPLGTRIRGVAERVTGVVLLALGVRLALERR